MIRDPGKPSSGAAYVKCLSLNIKKSKYILFSRKGIVPVCNDKLYLNNVELERVTQIKYLGFIIDEKLSWKAHINYISLKISKNIAVLKKLVSIIIIIINQGLPSQGYPSLPS